MLQKYFSFLIFQFVLSVSYCCYAQQEEAPIDNKDSVYRFQGIIPPVEYQYDLNQFFIEPLFNQIPDEILFEDNPSNIWLRTELLISYKNLQTENGEINTHFTSTLYQQYLQDSEFDMVRYVLGMAQAGA
ncbi:MAG TPA: hypothetical protein VIY47_08755, partial [Ignavibacteriaceae bacterium]